METYHTYRGWGVRYEQITGTTYVQGPLWASRFDVMDFPGLGEQAGKEAAHKFIDTELGCNDD